MKITNDAQAEKYKEYLQHAGRCVALESELNICDTLPDISAALAAWEARQIELTEDELVMLRYCELDHDDNEPRWVNARHLLQKRGLIDDKLDATPAGRAYLDAHKRELKWEVYKHGLYVNTNTEYEQLLAILNSRGIAQEICSFANRHWPHNIYEVREVK